MNKLPESSRKGKAWACSDQGNGARDAGAARLSPLFHVLAPNTRRPACNTESRPDWVRGFTTSVWFVVLFGGGALLDRPCGRASGRRTPTGHLPHFEPVQFRGTDDVAGGRVVFRLLRHSTRREGPQVFTCTCDMRYVYICDM